MNCEWLCTKKLQADQRVPFSLKTDDDQRLDVTLSKRDAINLGITLIEYAFAIELGHLEYPKVSGQLHSASRELSNPTEHLEDLSIELREMRMQQEAILNQQALNDCHQEIQSLRQDCDLLKSLFANSSVFVASLAGSIKSLLSDLLQKGLSQEALKEFQDLTLLYQRLIQRPDQ